MIRKIIIASAALAAVYGTAFAADLPSRASPPVFVPPPIPVFSWTGFYVGGQIGYGFGRDRQTLSAPAAPQFGSAAFNVGTANGLLGGGHVGYNISTQSFPLLGGFGGSGGVIGIEGDVNGSDYRSNQGLNGFGFGLAETQRQTIDGSVRGRLGIAVDRSLFYVTGGAAFSDFRNTYSVNVNNGGFVGFDSFDHTRVGFTVGGGVEYALTTEFSLRAEYRYSDFGSYSDILTNSTGGLVVARNRIIQNRAQIGFSYKFDNPVAPPVVARY